MASILQRVAIDRTLAQRLPVQKHLTLAQLVRCYVASYDVDALEDRERFVAVLVRAGDTPDPGSLLEALQAVAVRPATAAEINVTTDYAAPLVCPIGLGPDVLLLADAALGATDVLYTPTPGYSGPDSFRFLAFDSASQFPIHPPVAKVSLTVSG